MSHMTDPLTLVRQATITGSPVNYVDNCYIFGSHRFHESTPTCFKRTLKGNVYYYTLRDVIFFLENIESSVLEYRQLCMERSLVAVNEIDKTNLKSYLMGEIQTCSQIDQQELNKYNVDISTNKGIHGKSTDVAVGNKRKLDDTTELSSSSATTTTHHMGNKDTSTTTTSSAMSTSTGPTIEISKEKQKLLELRKYEIPVHTRTSVLSKAGADFSFILKLFNDYILKPKSNPTANPNDTQMSKRDVLDNMGQSTGSKTPSSKSPHTTTPGGGSGNKNYSYANPIIIVPAALTGVISIFNVQDILEKSTYVSIETKKNSGMKRDSALLLQRILSDGTLQHYKIIDNPRHLTAEEWNSRVVAVFVSGQAWQFKDWQWSNPIELFQHVVGIHLTLEGRTIDPTVQSWNCKILKINEFKRHQDAGVVNEIWTHIDQFIKFHKPWLIKQSTTSLTTPSSTLMSAGTTSTTTPKSSSMPSSSNGSSHHKKSSRTSETSGSVHSSSSSGGSKTASRSSHPSGSGKSTEIPITAATVK